MRLQTLEKLPLIRKESAGHDIRTVIVGYCGTFIVTLYSLKCKYYSAVRYLDVQRGHDGCVVRAGVRLVRGLCLVRDICKPSVTPLYGI